MNFLMKLFIALPIGWTAISVIRVIATFQHQARMENDCKDALFSAGHFAGVVAACHNIGDEAFTAGIEAAWSGWYQGMIPLLLILIAIFLYALRKENTRNS